MRSLLDDVSLPTDLPGLTAQIAELETRLAACREDIQTLLDGEDPAAGVAFAAEIHAAKQRLMMLGYQKDLRVVRVNQLRNAG